jgi:hypothetical protein
MKTPWTLSKVWNESLGQAEKRPVEVRSRIWASELGKSDIDVYLKMKGTEMTNPPNARAMRKFEAGNIWEWIMELILRRCGIYNNSQEYIEHKTEGCVSVTGKLDFIAGGVVDYNATEALLGELHLPDMFTRAIKNTLEYFKREYPEGLEHKVLEIKSVSSFAFDKVERTGKPIAGHDLQLFHYIYNKKIDGAIVYICRDDARMIEMFISHNDPELYAKYEGKIRRISEFFNTDTQPPKEDIILFDEADLKFSKNFNVEYSGYLTMVYGFVDQMDYDEQVSGRVERWNRVLGRMKDGKDMTDNNKEALVEMAEAGFDPEIIKDKILKANENKQGDIGEGRDNPEA